MFLGLGIEETLGCAFGVGVLVLSFWLVYQWAIKPERALRRQKARAAIEEIHRNYRDERRAALPVPQGKGLRRNGIKRFHA